MKRIAALFVFVMLFFTLPVRFSHAHEADDTKPDTFTIVWVSDTQDIAYNRYGDALHQMGAWIEAQKDAMNIKYIVQTGDAVDNGAAPRQWDEFDKMYGQFRDRIPFISAAGNHEVKKNGYFEYCMRPYIRNIPRDKSFRRGESAYASFDFKGEKFIMLAIGYGVEEASVDWANHVLAMHRDHTAILLFHDYMQDNGRFSINGKSMFRQIVRPNPNVRLVLCGHVRGVSSRIDAIDDNGDGEPDRRVAQLMYNYQHFGEECGQLRTMLFNTSQRTITITTYSPVTKRYYRDFMFGDEYTFTLKDAF